MAQRHLIFPHPHNANICGTGILFVGEQTSQLVFPENAVAGGLLAEKERGAPQSGDLVLSNEILARLPVAELDQIVVHLEHQHIPRHTVLCDPEKPIRYGYFLNSGMVSCLIPTSAGRNVEVALVGKGGFIGNSLAFGVNRSLLRMVMQVPGDGYRIKSDDLQRLLPTAPHLFRSVGRHALLQGMQAAQTAACNRLHNLEQRLARWLLMTQDRVGPEFAMTQEYLAQMLGTGRPSLSLTASQMQRVGAIQYTRGLMRVLDRAELEKLSCECYSVVRTMMADLELG